MKIALKDKIKRIEFKVAVNSGNAIGIIARGLIEELQ